MNRPGTRSFTILMLITLSALALAGDLPRKVGQAGTDSRLCYVVQVHASLAAPHPKIKELLVEVTQSRPRPTLWMAFRAFGKGSGGSLVESVTQTTDAKDPAMPTVLVYKSADLVLEVRSPQVGEGDLTPTATLSGPLVADVLGEDVATARLKAKVTVPAEPWSYGECR